MTRSEHILVVGGGIVGATAALGLAAQNFRVTLAERRSPLEHPSHSLGELGLDIRNVALSPASVNFLNQSIEFASLPSAAFTTMRVWEQWGTEEVVFTAAEVGREQLGWVIEQSKLTAALWREIEHRSNIEVVLGDVGGFEFGEDAVTAELAAGVRKFDFAIAADGAQSQVRSALNVKIREAPVPQVALATVIRTAGSHQHTAWQRFLTDGPLALLPAPDEHLCSVVWSQSAAAAERRCALSAADFAAELSHLSEYRLGKVLAVDRRISFPLTQQRADTCIPHARVALLGDAYRVVHPLAGLGVNLGLEDVAAFLQVSGARVALSTPGIWRRFARERQVRAQVIIRLMATLARLYGSASPGVTWLRNLGVQGFNAATLVKHQVMREALGLGPLARADH